MATQKNILSLKELEKCHITDCLSQFGWNVTRTAEALGITRKGLYDKMSLHNINIEKLRKAFVS